MTPNINAGPKQVVEDDTKTIVEWILWRHNNENNRHQSEEQWMGHTKEMSHFFAHPTQESFHIDLHHLPVPSHSFFLKKTRKINGEHKAEVKHTEYSLFQRGIRPEWEDPHCVGQLYAKHYFPPALLDRYWQDLAHAIMEGNIDDRYVTGIRVVDKSKGKHPMYKLELWLNTNNTDIRGKIRKQALACVQQDDHYRFNFHWREFDTGTDTASSSS